VLPLLEEFFGLVEEDLSERERGKSQRVVFPGERWSCGDRIDGNQRRWRACDDGERELTLCCLGSRTLLLASKRERMYKAWPRQR